MTEKKPEADDAREVRMRRARALAQLWIAGDKEIVKHALVSLDRIDGARLSGMIVALLEIDSKFDTSDASHNRTFDKEVCKDCLGLGMEEA